MLPTNFLLPFPYFSILFPLLSQYFLILTHTFATPFHYFKTPFLLPHFFFPIPFHPSPTSHSSRSLPLLLHPLYTPLSLPSNYITHSFLVPSHSLLPTPFPVLSYTLLPTFKLPYPFFPTLFHLFSIPFLLFCYSLPIPLPSSYFSIPSPI